MAVQDTIVEKRRSGSRMVMTGRMGEALCFSFAPLERAELGAEVAQSSIYEVNAGLWESV